MNLNNNLMALQLSKIVDQKSIIGTGTTIVYSHCMFIIILLFMEYFKKMYNFLFYNNKLNKINIGYLDRY